MSHTIEVAVQYQKKYPVYAGIDLWDRFREFCTRRYSSRHVFIIIDSKVNKFHGQEVLTRCAASFDTCSLIEIPEGEQSKSISEWNKLINVLLKKGIERNTPVVAVGGGVTGDLAGFAAASVLRGIPLIHLPTSLLAMVDSSIGGKTGVNHATGKNLIGAFYQPDAVFADARFLETLEKREWINGLAEIIKYAAIRSPEMFDQIGQLTEAGFAPSGKWVELIARSIRIKADIVREDTLEAGKRAFLNFGHTFGHALEKNAGYGAVSHGEAVFTGMLAACYASRARGASIDHARFDPFIPLYDINLDDAAADKEQLITLMRRDKKVKNGFIRLVLLNDWGSPVVTECSDEELLKASWEFALERIKR